MVETEGQAVLAASDHQQLELDFSAAESQKGKRFPTCI